MPHLHFDGMSKITEVLQIIMFAQDSESIGSTHSETN